MGLQRVERFGVDGREVRGDEQERVSPVCLEGRRQEVLAVDQSLGALAVASDNVRALGLTSRVRLLAGDLLAPLASLGGSLDMVVANPPYCPTGVIPTLPAEVERFEPRLALDGGPDGYECVEVVCRLRTTSILRTVFAAA